MLERTPAPIVVVDAECPEGTGNWAISLSNHRVLVERVRMPTWSAPVARNQGARRATSEGATHLVFLDADSLVQEGFWSFIEPRLDQDSCLFISPSAPDLMGALAVPVYRFFQVGGYDPRFWEYGHEDVDLRIRLYLQTGRFRSVPPELLKAIPHGDDLRLQFNRSKERSKEEQAARTLGLLAQKYLKITRLSLAIDGKSSVFRRLLGIENQVPSGSPGSPGRGLVSTGPGVGTPPQKIPSVGRGPGRSLGPNGSTPASK